MKVHDKTLELLAFFTKAGRTPEEAETWVHALVDIQESYTKIFEKLIGEALSGALKRSEHEVLWDIREEMRHISYHVQDIEGK
jgi:hypothetical protein